jgi:hypothetical protein
MKRFLLSFLFIAIAVISFSQNIRMYAETGGQGIKFGVLDFKDGFRTFKVVDNKEINIGLSAGIQKDGNILKNDIEKAVPLIKQMYDDIREAYSLKPEQCYFYVSSGIGVAKNIDDYLTALKNAVNKDIHKVKEDDEARYTIAGTVPFSKIDVAVVFDQGGSNSKGGYVIKQTINGKLILSATPVKYDMGSKRVEILVRKYMKPISSDDREDEIREYVRASQYVLDSLYPNIDEAFSNIQGLDERNELYLSGGAAFVITTLTKPTYDLKSQMIPLSFNDIKAFLVDLQDKDSYTKIKQKTFEDSKVQDNYKSALNVYSRIQLISATKLLLLYIKALKGQDKYIYFNRWGLQSMPSILIGKAERKEIFW